jgi:hypothetical protein
MAGKGRSVQATKLTAWVEANKESFAPSREPPQELYDLARLMRDRGFNKISTEEGVARYAEEHGMAQKLGRIRINRIFKEGIGGDKPCK